MEESLAYLKEQFDLKEVDIHLYSPLVLAFIGDGAYEMVIRTLMVNQGNCQVNKLHRKCAMLVKAKTQALMGTLLMEGGFLTEEEASAYRRGRNAKSATTAKNATTSEYRRATGFEALIGYLFLKEEMCRMIDLIKLGLSLAEVLPQEKEESEISLEQ